MKALIRAIAVRMRRLASRTTLREEIVTTNMKRHNGERVESAGAGPREQIRCEWRRERNRRSWLRRRAKRSSGAADVRSHARHAPISNDGVAVEVAYAGALMGTQISRAHTVHGLLADALHDANLTHW